MPQRKPPCPPNCPLRRPACQGSCPTFAPYAEQLRQDKLAKQAFRRSRSRWTDAKNRACERTEKYRQKKRRKELT